MNSLTNLSAGKNCMPGIHLLLLIICVIGCNREEKTDMPVQSFEIGVLLPLSGMTSSVSESAQVAISMAVEDIDSYFSNSGKNYQVALKIEDTGTKPDQALAAIRKLHQDGITSVVGPYTSANSAAILDYVNTNHIILLSPSSVATSLSIDDNLFRLVPNDYSQAEAITSLIHHDEVEVIIPVVRNDVWGNGLIENVSNRLPPSISLQEAIRYDPEELNPEAIISSIQAALEMASLSYAPEKIGIYLLTFDEGTTLLSEAGEKLQNAENTKWYGASPYANNAGLLDDMVAAEFALAHDLRCSVFGPDPDMENLWAPIRDKIKMSLGRTPEVYALTI